MTAAITRTGVSGMQMAVVADLELERCQLLQARTNGRPPVGHGNTLRNGRTSTLRIDTGLDVGIAVRPGFRRGQILEFGYDQAAAETGRTRIFGIDRRKRPGKQQTSLLLQRFKALQVGGPRALASIERCWLVVSDDRVPHSPGFPGGARMVADERARGRHEPVAAFPRGNRPA